MVRGINGGSVKRSVTSKLLRFVIGNCSQGIDIEGECSVWRCDHAGTEKLGIEVFGCTSGLIKIVCAAALIDYLGDDDANIVTNLDGEPAVGIDNTFA